MKVKAPGRFRVLIPSTKSHCGARWIDDDDGNDDEFIIIIILYFLLLLMNILYY